MENLAHTLIGLSIAKAGLERATPLATTTLVIASNLPDVDVLLRAGGITSYLEHHRGFTHSLIGLALLALALTLLITFFDRRIRSRRDPFLRPIRPARIFWLAYLGGLGHTFMDFTNSYGVRPLLPFSARWFYGDVAFVVDPWIWLILGSAVVWLSVSDSAKIIFWIAVGVALSLIVAFSYRIPVTAGGPLAPAPIPGSVRVIWFIGLAIIILGALLGWGRAGAKLARYSLLLLAIYYGGMWMANQSAKQQAEATLAVENSNRLSAWPMPANPLLWQSVATANQHVYTRYVDLWNPTPRWNEFTMLDPKFAQALRQSEQGRRFLDFARYTTALVEEQEDGYSIRVRDLRFPLQMSATLDQDLTIRSIDVRWF